MAKQKVNLRDTLQRNKQPQVELAPKVTLKKTDKDLEKISETVDFIHNETHETPQVEDPQLPFVMLVTEMKPNPFEGFTLSYSLGAHITRYAQRCTSAT